MCATVCKALWRMLSLEPEHRSFLNERREGCPESAGGRNEDLVWQVGGGKKVMKRKGREHTGASKGSLPTLQFFYKNASDVGFADAYHFERNRIKLILKSRSHTFRSVPLCDATM